MRIPYLKMHGTGNLILVVDQRRGNLGPPSVAKLRELANEATGPGFDQLMWLGPATNDQAIASYRVFNADGSEVEQCGNGVRCVARYLSEKNDNPAQFNLQSPAGIVSAVVHTDGQVAVSMGIPEFQAARVPFIADADAGSHTLDVDGLTFRVGVVSMGNPHCILQVDDVAKARIAKLGPQIEHHDRFPERTNVGFMRIIDRKTIDLRVYERGAGETLACGTGACAAVAYGQQLGWLDEDVSVRLPGGQVMVSWRGDDTPAWLKGNAELIKQGTMDLEE